MFQFSSRLSASMMAVLLMVTGATHAEDDDTPIFEFDVQPILQKHCVGCHGEAKQEAGLDVRTPTTLLRGGDTGPAVQPGTSERSLLFAMILDGTMPPKDQPRVSLAERETIRRWIVGGAPAKETYEMVEAPRRSYITKADRQHYSFRKLLRPESLPTVPGKQHSQIDRFVLARLQGRGIGFSQRAGRRTLLRRACFDLTGLPPSAKEWDLYLEDDQEGAFERLIDRLLDSDQFGVRWGRHWLDVAGYVDVYGSDENAPQVRVPPGGWRYRDYVVDSFNRDKPYDEFLIEQLAGDELSNWRQAAAFTPRMVEQLVATGFLRTAIDDTDQDVLNIRSNRFAVIFDQMEILGTSVLGLTLQCARCHSHKFDPVPTRDYYRLMANFTPAFNPDQWVKLDQRTLADVPPRIAAAIDAHNTECDKRIQSLRGRLVQLEWIADKRLLPAKLKAIPQRDHKAVRSAFKPVAEQTAGEKATLKKYAVELAITAQERRGVRSQQERDQVASLTGQISEIEATRRPGYGTIQALYDTGPPPVTRMLSRGQVDVPGRPVEPGFLSVLCDSETNALTPLSAADAPSSGRRLAVARWLTDRTSPASGLVARVAVNRVWHHLFGRGIVATPGNLGVGGAKPTHPQLLDWLAADFVENGWKFKPLIKRIMRSAVYQQASHRVPGQAAGDPADVDPENHLLWRMRLRRLESEIVRDAVLAVSGKLDLSRGGEPVPLKVLQDGTIRIDEDRLPTPTSHWRRSLYITSRRNYHMPIFSVFNTPHMTTNCTTRDRSTVVLQSLTMLNDEFVQRQAMFFAARIAESAPAGKRIALAFQIALARSPTDSEATLSRGFLVDQISNARAAGATEKDAQQQALESFCHMILNTNEFLYIE
ncbi:MAG: PSD1 and planctomycete cytochrome C domain-containing protein [Planctomycetota bacterium]|nr:PSD1 and planctomycete cytochrome C domain-containing protein [Planctomycetota bacterium]